MIIRNNSFTPVPMGFCYSGKGVSGDLPSRPECTPIWHQQVLSKMKQVKLVIFIRQHSQKYYLCEKSKPTLNGTVKNYKEYLHQYSPLVHPSPRNRIWQKKNAWFEKKAISFLQKKVV
jgi:uracil-DNA glycosylase